MFFSEAQMRHLGAVTELWFPYRRCAPTNVSILHPNAMGPFETSATAHPQPQHHIPEGRKVQRNGAGGDQSWGR